MRLSRNNGKIFWGLLFILAAAYMIISRIWILPEISVFTIILSVFLVWIMIKGLKKVNFWQILFPIAFLCILYDKPLGITDLTPWTVLGAALLGSIGLSMIFKPNRKPHFEIEYDSDNKPHFEFEYNSNGGSGVGSEHCTDERIHFENNFGESIKYVTTDNFISGHFENNFGSMSVYLDNAIIQGERATAVVECNFGEIQLFIPKEWRVLNNLEHAFGSIDERGRCEGTSTSTLVLNGEVNFGCIEIHYI